MCTSHHGPRTHSVVWRQPYECTRGAVILSYLCLYRVSSKYKSYHSLLLTLRYPCYSNTPSLSSHWLLPIAPPSILSSLSLDHIRSAFARTAEENAADVPLWGSSVAHSTCRNPLVQVRCGRAGSVAANERAGNCDYFTCRKPLVQGKAS